MNGEVLLSDLLQDIVMSSATDEGANILMGFTDFRA
jgi:hypothetical protein